jgi:hypothetical protein
MKNQNQEIRYYFRGGGGWGWEGSYRTVIALLQSEPSAYTLGNPNNLKQIKCEMTLNLSLAFVRTAFAIKKEKNQFKVLKMRLLIVNTKCVNYFV